MFIVTIDEAREVRYGPFASAREARRFADFMTREVDPARVWECLGGDETKLRSPATELLAWYERHGRGMPDVRATKIGERP